MNYPEHDFTMRTYLITTGAGRFSPFQERLNELAKFECQHEHVEDDESELATFLRCIADSANLNTPVLIIFDSCNSPLSALQLHEVLGKLHAEAGDYDVINLLRWQDRCDWNTEVSSLDEFDLYTSSHAHGDQAFLISVQGQRKILSHPLLLKHGLVPGAAESLPAPGGSETASRSAENADEPSLQFLMRGWIERDPLFFNPDLLLTSEEVSSRGDYDPLHKKVRGSAPASGSLDGFLHYIFLNKHAACIVVSPQLLSYDQAAAAAYDDYFKTHECLRPGQYNASKAVRGNFIKRGEAESRGFLFYLVITFVVVGLLIAIILIFVYASRRGKSATQPAGGVNTPQIGTAAKSKSHQ
jgi:hypothetical protein